MVIERKKFYGVGFVEDGLVSTLDLVMLLYKKEKEIENLKRELEEVKVVANRDCLTNVLNRRAGLEILERTVNQYKYGHGDLTIMFLDVDNFKVINDKFGHAQGDKLLLSLVKVLQETIRSTDTVFRIGGDEFVIVFPETNKDIARKICSRVLHKINAFNIKHSNLYKLSISYGIEEYNPKLHSTPLQLLDRADKKMYWYKSRKKKEMKEKCGII